MNFSVVIPCFRSTEALLHVVEGIASLYPNQCNAIILVQDGPDRATAERLSQCASFSSLVEVIELTENVGQHQAILCGIQHASADNAVITIDDDMQINPKEIIKLIDEFLCTEADLVYGVYPKRHHNLLRKGLGMIFGRVISWFSPMPSKGSSFKLISSELVRYLHHFSAPFVFIDIVLAEQSKLIAFSEVNHLPRKEGVSGYNWYKLTQIGFKIILHYTSIPIFVFFPLGTLLMGIPIMSVLCSDSMRAAVDDNIGPSAFGMILLFFIGLAMTLLGIIGYRNKMTKSSNATRHGFKIKLK